MREVTNPNSPMAQPPVDLSNAAERRRLSPSALKAFFRIVEAWNLTAEQGRALLGGLSNGRYHDLRKTIDSGRTDVSALKFDEIQRISFLIGITKALRILHERKLADRWMTLPNSNYLFGGRSPLEAAIQGGIPALAMIRDLLDGRRGFLS